MALTAATLYECIADHVTANATYRRKEIRRGDGVVQGAGGSPDTMWIALGSSDAAIRAQRAANGFGSTLGD